MKFIVKTFKLLPVLLLVVGLSACSDDDDGGNNMPEEQNMLEVIQNDPELAALAAALEATGLEGAIETSDPITVLAPTNAAFATFLDGADLGDVDVDVLAAILLNHVIGAEVRASDLVSAGTGYASSLSPNDEGLFLSIYFNATSGVRFNNAGSVTADGADIEASNGVLHKIDGVLDLPNIVDHVQNNSDFDTLGVALSLAGLVETVRDADALTILGPDNDAFAAFLGDTDPTTIPQDVLGNILLNHALAGQITSTTLTGLGQGYTTTLAVTDGDDSISLYFNTSDGVVFNGISTVEQADIVGTNGVIHGVETVIDLPTIATFATSNPALSGLVAAITRADEGDNNLNLLSVISDPTIDPLTTFAPADPAFDVLLDDLGADSLDDVDPAAVYDLILLHLVSGNIRSTDLPTEDTIIPTLGGDISINGTVITDGDGNTINILAPDLVDIQAVNGVVHAVDYVIRAAVVE